MSAADVPAPDTPVPNTWIVVRHRPCLGRTIREFLLVGQEDAGGTCRWTWPSTLPARFNTRVKDPRVLECLLRDVDGRGDLRVRVVEVDSSPHRVPLVYYRRDLVWGGVWVVRDDFTEKGGIGDRVPAIAAVYGIPIDTRAAIALHAAVAFLPPAEWEPTAVYHGTDLEAVPAIQGTGLAPSFGMLGSAVYLAETFWKAVRFASRTQDYRLRARGAIVRAYLDARRCKELNATSDLCGCAHCREEVGKIGERNRASCRPLYEGTERQRLADHARRWVAQGYDTVHVGVVPLSTPPGAHPQYASKTGEYAVRDPAAQVELEGVVELDMASVRQDAWDPEQRDQRIV